MFLSRNKKNNVYPCKPQFYYIKMGFEGVKCYRYVFVMESFFYYHTYITWSDREVRQTMQIQRKLLLIKQFNYDLHQLLFDQKLLDIALVIKWNATYHLSSALSSAGYFKSYFCKQCGPRSDCSFKNSLIWVHTVCLYAKIGLKKFARIFSRRQKSDDIFRCRFSWRFKG